MGIEETDGYIKTNSNNVSCIDNIDLYVKIENDIIKDVRFTGEACAVAISSTSIMLKEIIGKSMMMFLLIHLSLKIWSMTSLMIAIFSIMLMSLIVLCVQEIVRFVPIYLIMPCWKQLIFIRR